MEKLGAHRSSVCLSAAFVLNDDAGGGYTYYQLRDLGRALGFNVGWDNHKGIFVETNKP